MPHILSVHRKKRLEFFIHTAALPAFSFFHSREFWVDKTEIGLAQLESLSLGLSLQAVRGSGNRIEIISGFEYLSFSLTTLNFVDCEVLIHDNMSDEDIRKRSWLAVIRTMLSSLDSKSAEDFRRTLNRQAPKQILKALFCKSMLSQTKLSGLTHTSRSALAQQNTKSHQPQQSPSVTLSIFEQLVMEQKHND
ncbi:hypothetical protein [Vibrio sp. 99-70-13A1]|uniref:hypothetical protein n=1 Tax=Vibrio sp. 99-70-13A1 TaxID=2607601 RepID=UPI00149351BD|nr:hypothetical protein [Vibrio sp. 99-70-13A1]NOH98125.1 hypothetical protein [Vibrio sp. 99-70-13A1]